MIAYENNLYKNSLTFFYKPRGAKPSLC